MVECYIMVLFADCFWLLLDCAFISFVLGFGVGRLLWWFVVTLCACFQG